MNKNRKAGRDRLSRLPEPIIHHIVSFLGTKSAVQTSVLSRSWRCAWKHVPVLNFDEYSFQLYSNFVRYVDKALSLHYPVNLRKVSFVGDELRSEGRDDSLVIRVIQYALSRAAQDLVIYNRNDTISPDIYRFSDLFGSVSSCNLKTLRLRCFDLDRGFGSPGFRMLTTLDLVTCLVPYGQEVLEPFSNFPCLKYLVLCDWLSYETSHADERRLKIYGLELLSLTLDSLEVDDIDIYAPKLKFISTWDDAEYRRYSNLTLPPLDHADIGLHGDLGFIELEKEDIKTQLIISLFQGLHNAKSLKLYGDSTIQALSIFCGLLEDQPSPFLRLKSLILDFEIENVPYKLVNYFLKALLVQVQIFSISRPS